MTYKTNDFEVQCENLSYRLDLPINVEVDYWSSKKDGNLISWHIDIHQTSQGIKSIESILDSMMVCINWRIDKDDVNFIEQEMLFTKHNGIDTGNAIEGEIMIYTIRDKDKEWEVDFSVEYNGVIQPTEVIIDFIDKIIEVI